MHKIVQIRHQNSVIITWHLITIFTNNHHYTYNETLTYKYDKNKNNIKNTLEYLLRPRPIVYGATRSRKGPKSLITFEYGSTVCASATSTRFQKDNNKPICSRTVRVI